MTAMDFAEVMVAVEGIINPSGDGDAMLAKIERMVAHIQTAIPADAEEWDRIGAMRQYIYEPGYWNGNNAFAYDHDDPFGQEFGNRLLSDYLNDRRGNCITMPLLIIAIGQRMGLDMRPSLAPLHMLVRFTDADGRSVNLEATSGAGRARDQYYRDKFPITDEAIANRVFLATLTNEEAVAVIATPVVEYLIKQKRYHDAMAVADILLEHYPNFAYIMIKKATAAYYLIKTEFRDKYATAAEVPEDQRPYLAYLQRINQTMYEQAESLGWREFHY